MPRPISEEGLALQRRIDELHQEHPFAGTRMLRDLLKQEGIEVGRKHVATLMRRMEIEALVRRKSTSRRAPGHEIYPYLFRNMAIEQPHHVWALDITYIPMRRGFVYFVAAMDWATPYELLPDRAVTLSNRVASCLVSSRLENFFANSGWIATLARERAS